MSGVTAFLHNKGIGIKINVGYFYVKNLTYICRYVIPGVLIHTKYKNFINKSNKNDS